MVSSREEEAILIATLVVAAVSFVCSLAVVVSYCMFEQLRRPSYLLILHVAISDIGTDLSYALANPQGGVLCDVQAALNQVFTLTSVIFPTLITLQLYELIVVKARLSHHTWPIWATYAIAILSAVLPWGFGLYSNVVGWCWVGSDSAVQVGTRFAIFYGPLWVCLLFNVFVQVQVERFAASGAQGHMFEKALRVVVERLRFFPAMLFICWLPATINRIYESVTEESSFELIMFQTTFATAIGIGNAFLYFRAPAVRATWASWWTSSEVTRGELDLDVDADRQLIKLSLQRVVPSSRVQNPRTSNDDAARAEAKAPEAGAAYDLESNRGTFSLFHWVADDQARPSEGGVLGFLKTFTARLTTVSPGAAVGDARLPSFTEDAKAAT